MTGLCCRCQVRHDDDLCCRHGVICPEHGNADVLLVLGGSVVLGAVVAVCAYLGQTADDGTRLAVGVVLAVAALVTLRFVVTQDVDDDPPPPWVGPGHFTNEPEEH